MTAQLTLSYDPAPAPRRPRSFHTRHQIPGPALQAASEIAAGERRARTQDNAVLAFYRANPGAWGPSQVHASLGTRYPWAKFLLTSTRRSITNLTKRGLLRMTGERRPGPFGAMEHLWEVAE